MAFQVGPNFVQTPVITQTAEAHAAAATAFAGTGGAQGAAAAGGDFAGKLQNILQQLQSLAAQLGVGGGAQAQGPFMPGAPNPADAGGQAQAPGGATAQGGAAAGAGAAAATAVAGIGADGKPFAYANAGGATAQAGGAAGAGANTGAATGSSSSGASAGAGAMSGDDTTIKTKGGYEISSTGGGSWSIKGPDGKKTDIAGDPHVAEGDGGRWDFNKDATFALPDGTKVNVKVDNLVSSKLEVTDGNQRAEIDAQTGKAGPVTNGPAQFNTQGDQFAMGKDAEQWTKDGKEIKGGGMDGNQELGDAVPNAANAAGQAQNGAQAQAPQGGLQGIVDQLQGLLQQLGVGGAQAPAANAPTVGAANDPVQGITQQLQQLTQQLGGGQPAAAAQPPADAGAAQAAQGAQGQGGMQEAMAAITKMVGALGDILNLLKGVQGQPQALAA